MPRVTVVIATYNWSEVLAFSIASVLDQTFTDFELIVAGDCCSDDSAEVVGAIEDPRVSWLNLHTRVRHQSGPNNAAIARSDSDLIAYLGHDDLWLPHHLQTLVAAMPTGRPAITHSSALFVRPDGELVARPTASWAYRKGQWIVPSSVVHSRSLIDSVGPWQPPWETGIRDSEVELWARMSAAIGRPPTWVREVTLVKISAAARRDVYIDRPSHEQQAWLERIRSGETWTHHLEPATSVGRFRTTVRNHALDAIPQPVIDWSTGTHHRPRRLVRESAEQRWLRLRAKKGLNQVD